METSNWSSGGIEMQIRVELNGTKVNHWHKLGLTQNPFPQIARAEYTGACIRLQSLGGDPIPEGRAAAYIRERLEGFTEEFINLCIQQYRPGAMVRFIATWPMEE